MAAFCQIEWERVKYGSAWQGRHPLRGVHCSLTILESSAACKSLLTNFFLYGFQKVGKVGQMPKK